MAIDADLNAGVIDQELPNCAVPKLLKNQTFYPWTALKFVRGDAVAGLLILIINLVGGLMIGLLRYDMTLSDAARAYICSQSAMVWLLNYPH